jgi:hypothetical protein
VHLPELAPGEYIVTAWHTLEGRVLDRRRVQASGPGVTIAVDVGTDLALALVRIRPDVDRT